LRTTDIGVWNNHLPDTTLRVRQISWRMHRFVLKVLIAYPAFT
jgi:hypothetical protein